MTSAVRALGVQPDARLSVLEALPRLAHALLQHLIAYADLLYQESVEAAHRVRRSAVGFAVAAAAGFLALELACLWVIAATWDGPRRLTAVGALCIGFALIAVISGVYASGALAPGGRRPFAQVREEWRADMEELTALDPTLTGADESSAMGPQSASGGE